MSDKPAPNVRPFLRFFKVLYGIFTVVMVIWAILYVPAIVVDGLADHDYTFILMTTKEYLVAGVIWGAIAISGWVYRYVKNVPPEDTLR